MLALLNLALAFVLAVAAPAQSARAPAAPAPTRTAPAAPAPERTQASMQIELRTTGATPKSFTIHPGWNYLDRSLGLHWFRLGTLEELRFSNGVTGKNGGGFFFDTLVVRAQGNVTPLLLRPNESVIANTYTIASGGGHWFEPRAVLTRRFSVGVPLPAPAQVSRTLVPTGTAIAAFAPKLADLGRSREARLRAALSSGRADESVQILWPAVGIWQPADDMIGYAHGGRGIVPSPGYEQNFAYSALLADSMRERNNVDLLDAATGEPVSNPGGVNLADFANTLPRWGAEWAVETKVNPWYSTWGPKSWNSGNSPEVANLLQYQIIDGQHYGRACRDDVACANLFADPLCAFNLKVSCLRAMEAWPAGRLDATSTPGVLGREYGWITWTVASTRELAVRGVVQLTRAQLASFDAWLAKAAAVYVRCQIPAGTWQCTPFPWPSWSPAPQDVNVPADRGLALSHEHGLLSMGAYAVWRQLPDADLRDQLSKSIQRAADVWVRPGAPHALHYLVGKTGTVFAREVTETWGVWDTVYMWAAASYANRTAQADRPSGLSRLFGAADPDRFLDDVLRINSGTPAAFATKFSNTSDTYLDWNIDIAVDVAAASLAGWKP